MDKHALDGLALLHDLVPFLPVDRLFALLHRAPLPQETTGSALFADISGFTMLAEALARELGPERGSEELNTQINYTFTGLIEIIDQFQGAVIRFSGDGITAWFTGEQHTRRAVATAIAMQRIMVSINKQIPTLKLKVGIGSGLGQRFDPGDPVLGQYDVLAGPAIQAMLQSEKYASPGDIVICPATHQQCTAQIPTTPADDGYYFLTPSDDESEALLQTASRWESIRWMRHIDRAWELVEACRPYLPPPLYERVLSGHGAYLADLRLVAPLFIRFTGLDYGAEDAARKLDELVRTAQAIINRHGGHLNEVGIGDKGSEMVALFGAPLALENPEVYAAAAADDLVNSLPHIETLHIGLTSGALFTSTVGSPMRRVYAAIGDEVNLAARLMSRATSNEILANYRVYNAASDFAWDTLEPIRVKGKVAPVRLYKLIGLAASTRPLWPSGQFVARTTELAALNWVASTHQDGTARTLLMIGEPGLGKSHLIGEYSRIVHDHGVTSLYGAGNNMERQTPYRAWRDIFNGYFAINKRDALSERQVAVQQQLAQIAPELVIQQPLLNDILGLNIPENRYTSSLEPAERHTALINLLILLLQAWLQEDALAIILDNAQWLDALSWDLTYQITLQIPDKRLSLLISMRPFKDTIPGPYLMIEQLKTTRQLALQPLDAKNAEALAAEYLGVRVLPSPITRLIMQHTGGNPFFIREVTNVLVETGIIHVEDGKAALIGSADDLVLPDTVQGVIRSRIDRLPPGQQTVLKIASVIGIKFRLDMLRELHPVHIQEDDLKNTLASLHSMDITYVEDEQNTATYQFKYALTREIAYNTLSFAQRRQLHQAVARWYEQAHQHDLDSIYSILVHHWHEAEEPEQESYYCRLAGFQSAAQFANNDAIIYLERALALAPIAAVDERYDITIELEGLYHLQAAQKYQFNAINILFALAEENHNAAWQAHASMLLARYHERYASYSAGVQAAQQAFDAAKALGNESFMGLSAVTKSRCLIQLGRYDDALVPLQTIYSPDNDHIEAMRLDALGTTNRLLGHYDDAHRLYEAARQKANADGDRAAVGHILHHLGDTFMAQGAYLVADQYFHRSLTIRRAIGDHYGEAATLSQRGQLMLTLGDYDLATELLNSIYAVFAITRDHRRISDILVLLAHIDCLQQNCQAAQEKLLNALEKLEHVDDALSAIMILLGLAHTALQRKDWDGLRDYLLSAEVVIMDADRHIGEGIHCFWYMLNAQEAFQRGDCVQALYAMTQSQLIIDQFGLANLPRLAELALLGHEVLTGCEQHAQAVRLITDTAHILLQRADRLDGKNRYRYLQQVKANHEILRLHQQNSQATET